jgi:hypothetical protein
VQGSGAASIQAVFQSSVRGKWKKTFKTCIFCPFRPFPVLIIDIVIDLIENIIQILTNSVYYYIMVQQVALARGTGVPTQKFASQN